MTNSLWWIVITGVGMCLIAVAGSIVLLLPQRAFDALMLPLVALAAGSLIGGAFFHMIPAALTSVDDDMLVWVLLLVGFTAFMMLEQTLHWHHCHRAGANCRKPLTYLVLLGDGLHNFIGGLAIAGTFIVDVRLGLASWLAAAAHELPQELGDFGVLIHGGWSKRGALTFNVLSASTFLLGGLVTYWMAGKINVALLIPIAAGNFLYIGATDLVPELNKHDDLRSNCLHLAMFVLGVGLMYLAKVVYAA